MSLRRIALVVLCLTSSAHAQAPDTAPFASLAWRNIGPNRGGRSIAVAGSSARPSEYYFGATGGGLWKTTDGGISWAPVTDGQLASSSVGAVAVAPSNPDVVWLAMGETQLRGNVMQGDGMYRSTDGGRTWRHAGLANVPAIGRVRVDPSDPDRAYVAALGDPFGPSDARGIYRTTDGGKNWRLVLQNGPRAGGVDLVIDPNNPQVLFATLWEVYRAPWILSSGGPGSGLYKSTDGGDTWQELTRAPGLPDGVRGKMTVAVSGADSRRVYANIEAVDGGLHRSDDGGATWVRINAHRDLWQRAFYFLRVVADPKDRETVYVLSFQLERSRDGGRSFTPVPTPHADHHDLWIDPRDPQRMVEANDGGAVVTTNGGRTWTSQRYPTAQIYRVTTTDERPYHVCGAQQDNTTVCVPSRDGGLAPPGSAPGDWYYAVGGGESADIATVPGNPDRFYAGSTNTLTTFDRRHATERDVQPWPRIVMGEPASAMPERWNWTYPLATTARDPRALYAGSQHLWKSRDEGRTWRKMSPDLTRADPATMGNSGGPIVFDQDGPEVFATIFTIAPS
ncbi:MAG: glycosyl hydrolase, partial [Gemmatimonadetes bacterium]|nr:glycosyl hydrolase [Gemmatimonadota bacterium]